MHASVRRIIRKGLRMKKPASAIIKPILLGISLIIGFMFIFVGIGMEEFYEIAGNALTL